MDIGKYIISFFMVGKYAIKYISRGISTNNPIKYLCSISLFLKNQEILKNAIIRVSMIT